MAEVKATLFNEIIKYAQKEKPTNSDRNTIVDTIFNKLNTDSNNQLDNNDQMNDFYKKYFGIDISGSLTKAELKKKIDDIAYEMSFEEDGPVSDYAKAYEKKKNLDNAYEKGSWLYEKLSGATDERYYTRINKYIDSERLDKDNIIGFLSGFYSHNSNEGIIEYLDDEHDDVGKIKMENKKNIIQSLINRAEELGLSDDPDVEELKMFLDDYSGEEMKNEKTFNNGGWCDFSHGIWEGILSIFGDRVTDNEKIDKCLKSLYETIKVEEEMETES